jgi:hypothetical protein
LPWWNWATWASSQAPVADFGHRATCVDKDASKIDALNAGEIPIFEPGLKELVAANVRQGRLSFTTNLAEGLDGAAQSSSRLAPPHGAEMVMPISPTSMAWRARSPRG